MRNTLQLNWPLSTVCVLVSTAVVGFLTDNTKKPEALVGEGEGGGADRALEVNVKPFRAPQYDWAPQQLSWHLGLLDGLPPQTLLTTIRPKKAENMPFCTSKLFVHLFFDIKERQLKSRKLSYSTRSCLGEHGKITTPSFKEITVFW
jgi:hypothetical protein